MAVGTSRQARAGDMGSAPVKWRFALAAVALSFVLAIAAFFAADTYSHAKFDGVVGLNREGYRGLLVPHSHPDIKRVVVLGGSTAFGYGVPWQDAWPNQLQILLANGTQVVNLGYNAEGAASFRPTLEDYAYLTPDLVILYEGYNDLAWSDGYGVVNSQVYRRQSPLFRWTGYYAILPLVLHEKWLAVSAGGRLDEAYRSEKIIFHPTLAQRTAGGLLGVADVVTRQVTGPLTMPPPPHVTVALVAPYIQHVEDAVLWAHDRNIPLVVVGQPLIREDHQRQQAALAAHLETFRPWVPTVRYLQTALDLHDTALAFDGMHLTAAGNKKIAEAVAPVVRDLIQ